MTAPALRVDNLSLAIGGALVVDNVSFSVAPTYDDVAAARYPLSRLTYLNMNKRPGAPLEPALSELTRFIVSRQGQRAVRDQGIFLPLRANQSLASASLLAGSDGTR